jgi:hypothetical protein
MSAIQVAKRVIQVSGKEFVVAVLSMRDGDYVTYQQAADVLGTSVQVIKKTIQRHGVSVTKCHLQELRQLKQAGVIAHKAPSVNIINQAGMRVLVKILDTPMAWEVYETLWGATKEVLNAAIGGPNDQTALNDLMKQFKDQQTELADLREGLLFGVTIGNAKIEKASPEAVLKLMKPAAPVVNTEVVTDEIQAQFNRALALDLNASSREFVNDLQEYYNTHKKLSPKQLGCLGNTILRNTKATKATNQAVTGVDKIFAEFFPTTNTK